MRLTLAVLRCPASAVTETRSFDGGEISLGRGSDNDWVLADPERHLSKRHCILAFHGGGWQVADLSTNGTYLNGASQPLGHGQPSPLETGDRLRLGDYEMEVRIAPAHAASTWADPAWQPPRGHAAPSWQPEPSWPNAPPPSPSAGPWREDPFGQDPFRPGPSEPAPSSLFGASEARPAGGITLPADYDPMAPDGDSNGNHDGWGRHPTQADHTPALSEAFRPAPPGTGLPDDWADDLLADLPAASPPAPAARPPAPPPAVRPAAPAPGQDPFAPAPEDTPPTTARDTPPAPRAPAGPFGSDPLPFEPPAAPPPAAPPDAAPPPAHPPPAHPPPAHPPPAHPLGPPPPAAAGSLVAAFLAGAELGEWEVADGEAAMRQAGAMLRAAVAGLRQVLIARSAVKSEFRIERTMLSARGNNPLKVSVDDDAALETLLGPPRRSDMAPAQAVTDALRDVRLHELATMAAMQSAIRAVVAAFDPAALLAGAGGGLAMARKARAWDTFEALHAKVTQGLTDDFDSVFGKSFARAYEQAQAELSAPELSAQEVER